MSAIFDWSAHVFRDALATSIPQHRQYGRKLVAANNEFIHPIIEDLFLRFCREFDPEKIRHYPDHQVVIERIARFLRRPAHQVLLSAGSDAAIQILLTSIGKPSGRLLLQWPNYNGYESYARLLGIEIERVPVLGHAPHKAETRLADAMRAASPALVAISNPSGIDGSCLSVHAVGRLARRAQSCGHVLIVDEAYIGFSDVDHLGELDDYPNVVVLRSFSKWMGLAGLRVGAVVFGDAFGASYVRRWFPGNAVSVIAAHFAAFCLDRSFEIEAARSEIVACREWVRQRASALLRDWHIPASAANYVYLQAPTAAANAVLVRAFEEARIAVRDVSRDDANSIRVTVGHRPVGEQIVDVIEDAARKLYSECRAAP